MPFVGRDSELSFLIQRLKAAGRGEGGLALVSGEPGIGKSRLLEEFAARARSSGWLVLEGRTYDTDGMPPYLPFIEALQGHVRRTQLDVLRGQLGDGAPEIALLLPDVRRKLPDTPFNPPLEPQSERFQLFESVASFLSAIARTARRGLLLCLEDLHWADEASLLLFDHVSRRLADSPILLVTTYRDTAADAGPAFARALEQLARRDGSHWLQLQRLARHEVGTLLARLGQPEPPAVALNAFYQETEGNPFFVCQVFDYLSKAGRLFDSDGAWRQDIGIGDTDVPMNARIVITRRFESVSEECRRVLGLASVMGRTFNYELLNAVADLDEDALLDAIDEAVAAHLLAAGPQGITYVHELIRQTLFSSLSQPRRQAFHHRIAGAIEELYASDLDSHLADLALHYGSGGTSSALEKSAAYAARAGDRATLLLAFEEALRLYDVALAVTRSRDSAQREALPDLLVKRAEVLIALARWPESREAFQAAASFVAGERRAEILLGLAGAALRPQIDVPLARSAAQEVVRLSSEVGRSDLTNAARALLAECDLDDGEIRSALIQYEDAFSQGVELRLPSHKQFLSFPRALYWAGRIDEAVERGRQNVAGAHEVRDVISDAIMSTDLGLALASNGRYGEALAAFAHAKTQALSSGSRGIKPLLARATGMSCVVPMELFDYASAEHIAEEAREIARSADFMLPYVSEGIDLMCVYARTGELDRAAQMATEIGELLHHGVGSHGPIWDARLAEAKAELALARNDLSEAVVLAESALEFARAIGRPKYEALSLLARGNALVRRGKKRDGIADLRQAVEVVRPMGAPALFLRASSALLAVEGDDTLVSEARQATERILANLPEDMQPSFLATTPVQLVYGATGLKATGNAPRPAYPDGLTEREVEVLRLIASGRSSREVAEELVLSARTVERHIANIYLKTNTHGRAQVTAYALQKGLA